MSGQAPSAPETLLSPLTAVVRRVFAGAEHVDHLRRLSGGASQETWGFDAVGPDLRLPLILRRAPGGERQHDLAVGLEGEAQLMRLAKDAGVPEPQVHYVLMPADGLGRGFVTGFVEGETLGRRIVRDGLYADARKTLAHRSGELLARIHRIPVNRLPPLRTAGAQKRFEELYARYRLSPTPRPVVVLAFEWLRDRLPANEPPPRLVHGDFRNGNLIIGPDGIRAVLDWEIAHLGDPIEDLGWMCVGAWRFGAVNKPVGGFGSRESLLEGYAAGGGGSVDRNALKFWEVLGTLSWCVSCASMTAVFRSGVDATSERAMIARRASESEIDLLNLLAPRG